MTSLPERIRLRSQKYQGKKNKVEDTLSRRVHELSEINISRAESDLEQRIRTTGINDENYTKMMGELQNRITNSDKLDLSIDKKGLLRFKNRLYIPNSTELKVTVFDKVHKKLYSGHLGYQKTITTLRKLFYWPNMKGETVEYLARCQDCQQVKAKHQHIASLLQPLLVP
jgi:hypothetical protein